MEDLQPDSDAAPPAATKPKMSTVLILLVVVALTFSYLGAYAVANVLVTTNIIAPWPPDRDPRPDWMLRGFGGLMGVFVALAGIFRFLSGRQLRRIDQMSEE